MDASIIVAIVSTVGLVAANVLGNLIQRKGIEKEMNEAVKQLRIEIVDNGKLYIKLDNEVTALKSDHEFDNKVENLFKKSIDLKILNNCYLQSNPYNFALRAFADDISYFCITYENNKARKSEEITKDNLKVSFTDDLKMIHSKFDATIAQNRIEKGHYVNNKLHAVHVSELLSKAQELLGFNKEKEKFIQELVDNGFEPNDKRLRTTFYHYFDQYCSFAAKIIKEFEDLKTFKEELEKA